MITTATIVISIHSRENHGIMEIWSQQLRELSLVKHAHQILLLRGGKSVDVMRAISRQISHQSTSINVQSVRVQCMHRGLLRMATTRTARNGVYVNRALRDNLLLTIRGTLYVSQCYAPKITTFIMVLMVPANHVPKAPFNEKVGQKGGMRHAFKTFSHVKGAKATLSKPLCMVCVSA